MERQTYRFAEMLAREKMSADMWADYFEREEGR